MKQRIITLCYRKMIDANCSDEWSKNVFAATYQEFKMQAQFYNQQKKHTTYKQLIEEVQGANKLNFLVSAAIIEYLKELNDQVPDVVNNLGRSFLRFKNFQFEINKSDITNSASHVVAIYFMSQPLIWHDTVGDQMITSEKYDDNCEMIINQFRLSDNLGIYTLQTLEV
ncbi:hypothetical protein [Pinibacter soli]|uniref:Uncharacterized protein n=1 Tax=Pinibacter soli TaxID=3044211 RepID=A0ABT6RG18_9BACT|nr:hypothetical protein [Pinibacter soli]MDI3321514.1 hypothetical protein [Pinibacter soli]